MNTHSKATKYFIYTRKSSEGEDRQMLSIPAQLDEARRIVENEKLVVVGEPFCEQKSAKAQGRPLFNEMIRRIERGEADGIICWKLDRLARNFIDGGKVIDMIQRGTIKEIRTPSQVYTPYDNVLMPAVEFGMANQFILDLSANIKRGQRRKAEMGVPHGVASIGYLNDKTGEKGSRRWHEDPLRYPLVKQLFERFLTGHYAVRELWRYAKDELGLKTPQRKRLGDKPLSLSYLYKLLANPIYAGFFYYEEVRYTFDTKLRRMISEAEYWQIQTMLGRKGRPKPQKRVSLYSGFMRCGVYGGGVVADHKFHLVCSSCGRKFSYINREDCPQCGIEIDNMDRPVYRSYVYYQSIQERKTPGVRARAIEEKRVNAFVEDYLRTRFTISPALSKWCVDYIDELKDKELSDSNAIRQARAKAHDDAKRQQVELVRMRAKGLISDEEFSLMREELGTLLRNAPQADSADWTVRAKEIISLSATMLEVMQRGSLDDKRSVLSKLGSNLVLTHGKLSISNTKSVQAFLDGLDRARGKNPRFEPAKIVDCTGRNEDFAMVIPSLCGGIENVRTYLSEEKLPTDV